MQQERVFFGEDHNGIQEPTHEEKIALLDRVFSKFIGNESAVRTIKLAAYTALSRYNHEMQDVKFAFFGPASAGKTTLARLYAEAVDLPFLEISPKSVKTVECIFKAISNELVKCELPLIPDGNEYIVPPMVVFIDEVHALPDSIVQGLLKATEFNDAQMNTEKGKYVDVSHVTWMIATTDEGQLFDAFRTRFTSIMLKYLNLRQVADVIKLSNTDFSEDLCLLIARYNSRITRKGLEFARLMRMDRNMNPGDSWEEIAHRVARDRGIDEYGMESVHLKILRALSMGPIARNRITYISGRKEEETERFIMPWLMSETDDQPAYVTMSPKGYIITEAGRIELEKRKIVKN